jgi:hypothetical protein
LRLGAVTVAVVALLAPAYFVIGFTELAAPICALILLFLACAEPAGRRTAGKARTIASWVPIAGAGALLAVGPLVKASMLPVALGIITTCSAHTLRHRRRGAIALLIVPFLMVWFGVFALIGGGIASGISWPIAEIPLVTGYSAAMGVEGSNWHLALAAILAALALSSGIIALQGHPDRWWYNASVTLLWLIAFKEGFVRQDDGHVLTFLSLAPWCALLLWLPSQSIDAVQGSESSTWASRVACTSTVAACMLCFVIFGRYFSITLPSVLGVASKLQDLASLTWSAEPNQASFTALEKAGVSERPGLASLVPLLHGHNAFAWPWDGNAIIAAGARQELPPIPQEYSAYAESLDRKDAKFFSSPSRPPLGLVSVQAIDGRLPLQTAGMSFLRLLACYRPVALSGAFLLVKSSAPASSACSAASRLPTLSTPWRQGRVTEWIPVPSRPGNITFLKLRIRMTALGLLAKWLFRPTPLRLNMRLSHGETRSFRMVHATLPDGVLVSTILSSETELVKLWSGIPESDVTTVALSTGPPIEWASAFSYRFVFIRMPSFVPPQGLLRGRAN